MEYFLATGFVIGCMLTLRWSIIVIVDLVVGE